MKKKYISLALLGFFLVQLSISGLSLEEISVTDSEADLSLVSNLTTLEGTFYESAETPNEENIDQVFGIFRDNEEPNRITNTTLLDNQSHVDIQSLSIVKNVDFVRFYISLDGIPINNTDNVHFIALKMNTSTTNGYIIIQAIGYKISYLQIFINETYVHQTIEGVPFPTSESLYNLSDDEWNGFWQFQEKEMTLKINNTYLNHFLNVSRVSIDFTFANINVTDSENPIAFFDRLTYKPEPEPLDLPRGSWIEKNGLYLVIISMVLLIAISIYIFSRRFSVNVKPKTQRRKRSK